MSALLEWLHQMTLVEGLAAVAGVVLLGVLANGVWTARQARPRQPERSADNPQRLEPQMDQAPGAPGGAGGSGRSDPAASAPPAAAQPEGAGARAAPSVAELTTLPDLPPSQPRKTARLDPLIDAMAMLTVDAPISGDLALAHLPGSRRAGSKPFHIEGLNADSDQWELPQPGQRYREFQGGVQLANRSGPLNEIEYSEFVQKLQAFADAVGAMPDLPDMLDVVARARELDAFAGQHDAQLAITLRTNHAAWSIGYLQQTAARHGFVPGVLPGRLVLPSAEDNAPPSLVLSYDPQAALADDPQAQAVRSLQLSLDVPQTPESAEPFPAWHQAARLLAAELDAMMVDDQGRAITLHAFAAIGDDLNLLYRALEARDLPAGSPAARRLFS